MRNYQVGQQAMVKNRNAGTWHKAKIISIFDEDTAVVNCPEIAWETTFVSFSWLDQQQEEYDKEQRIRYRLFYQGYDELGMTVSKEEVLEAIKEIVLDQKDGFRKEHLEILRVVEFDLSIEHEVKVGLNLKQ